MVSIAEVRTSNEKVSSALPANQVAVFLGATHGIGEFTLKEFAKHTVKPRVYFAGRSQEAGDRVAAECKALNPEGEFIFTKADLSLLRTVDDVCRDIKSKEEVINLLFLSMGSVVRHTETSEGLHCFTALPVHCRNRFIVNLLPLIQQATGLRRVITVGGGTKEGQIHTDDFMGRHLSLFALRPHLTSMITLSLEAIAKSAPDVSFIHEFPGPVKTNLGQDDHSLLMTVFKTLLSVVGPFIHIPQDECGERHLYIATTSRYPPRAQSDGGSASGVPLGDGAVVAQGTTGEVGSGVYSINWDGESAGPKVQKLLAQYREQGMVDTVWDHINGEFKRITGSERI